LKKRLKIFKILLSLSCFVYTAKAQLVINNAAALVIANGSSVTPSYLVLNNPPATPITTFGTTGGIMMESEYNITQYNIKTGTTSITVPILTYTLEQIPLAVTGISAGTETTSGSGKIRFSTKTAGTIGTARSSGWDNFNYMPSDVQDMNGYNGVTPVVDNSANVIDRFWIIDAKGYSTSPGATFSFGYVNAEAASNGGNTLSIPNLMAMAYDLGATTWGNYGPAGINTTGGSVGTVSGVSLPAGEMGNIFRSWTLVDKVNVLPIELLKFSAKCSNSKMQLAWVTATETNSNYFTIEKSFDGINFTFFANIAAAHNSTSIKTYTYTDNGIIETNTYYRLSETDFNGAKKTYSIIVANNCNDDSLNENINIFSFNQNVYININSLSNQSINVNIYDATGRLIYGDKLAVQTGTNSLTLNPQLASGVYLVEVTTATKVLTQKVPLINN
jgi:hypothetical protein